MNIGAQKKTIWGTHSVRSNKPARIKQNQESRRRKSLTLITNWKILRDTYAKNEGGFLTSSPLIHIKNLKK
jgi:hypothetical protein